MVNINNKKVGTLGEFLKMAGVWLTSNTSVAI